MKREVLTGSGTPTPMAHYCQGVLAGDTRLRRRPDRFGLQDRRAARGAPGSGVSLLRLRHPEAGALRPGQHPQRLPGRRLRVQGRGQVAGVPYRPQRLLLLRPGVEGVLPFAAAAHHGAGERRCWSPAAASRSTCGGCSPRIERAVVTGSQTPTPMAHYCQGVLVGDTLYAAGQIASDYKTGVPPEARQDPAFPYYGSTIQKQARYILNNLRSVFQAAGCDLKDVVKSQVFLTDLNDFYYFDQVWKEFFPSPPPRTTVQVSGLLVPGCKVEIDLWGVRPGVQRASGDGREDAGAHGALLPGRAARRHALRRGPDRVGLQDRRAARGAPGSGVPLLRLRHPEADALRAGEPAQRLPGGRLRSQGHGEVAGLPHRPQRLPLFRPGVEGVLSLAAAAHHGAGERAARARLPRRDRPDGGQVLSWQGLGGASASFGSIQWSSAPREPPSSTLALPCPREEHPWMKRTTAVGVFSHKAQHS